MGGIILFGLIVTCTIVCRKRSKRKNYTSLSAVESQAKQEENAFLAAAQGNINDRTSMESVNIH